MGPWLIPSIRTRRTVSTMRRTPCPSTAPTAPSSRSGGRTCCTSSSSAPPRCCSSCCSSSSEAWATTAEDPTSAAAESEAAEQSAEETAAEEEAEPAPEPDLTTPVLVVNAGGINGLAGTWRDTLEGEGWEDVSVTTSDNAQQEPVVFYRDEGDADTAQALAERAGAGEARQSDEYDARITLVAVAEPGDAGGDAEGEG